MKQVIKGMFRLVNKHLHINYIIHLLYAYGLVGHYR
mgnify:CR=1 FL=1